jgi:phenylalanine-4-hydroxylase
MNKQNISLKESLPPHLSEHIVDQNYDKYTAEKHATWRYTLQQAKHFLTKNAHQSYLQGLEATGISIQHIPNVSDIDKKLQTLGWRACCIRGFIPPMAFLEFQSRNILPIATDIRSIKHIDYTPAPDIIHEAAGHAPMLVNKEFRDYLNLYAQLSCKAIYSEQDTHIYQAIRTLSDMKENPDYSRKDIANAEKELEKTTEDINWTSEANELSRLYWWTAEYGLIGDIKQPKIYGAGLLSSLEESQTCLKSHIIKHHLSLACIKQNFDITTNQPQLYVAQDFTQLKDLLLKYKEQMCFYSGGTKSLHKAKRAATLTHTTFENKLSVSGVVETYEIKNDTPIFIAWSGPVQLAYKNSQLQKHATTRHPLGFSSPIGRWKNTDKPPCDLNDYDLNKIGIHKGAKASICFDSGIIVSGCVKHWLHSDERKLLLITWSDCRVYSNNKEYYKPEWGEFDMIVGREILSIGGGASDPDKYPQSPQIKIKTNPNRLSELNSNEIKIISLYQEVKNLRKNDKNIALKKLQKLSEKILHHHPKQWLLGLELIESVQESTLLSPQKQIWMDNIIETILKHANKNNLSAIKRGFTFLTHNRN